MQALKEEIESSQPEEVVRQKLLVSTLKNLFKFMDMKIQAWKDKFEFDKPEDEVCVCVCCWFWMFHLRALPHTTVPCLLSFRRVARLCLCCLLNIFFSLSSQREWGYTSCEGFSFFLWWSKNGDGTERGGRGTA